MPPSPPVVGTEPARAPGTSKHSADAPLPSRARLEPLQRGATADPIYLELAEATGGRVTQSLEPGAGSTSRLISFQGQARERLRLPFAIDSTISKLAVSTHAGGPLAIRLLDPEGGVLDLPETRPGRADYLVHDLPRGTWQLDVTGGHGEPLEIEVQCESSLSVRVRTKEAGGRPGHMGWFSLVGRPTFGRSYLLEAEPRHPDPSLVSEMKIGLASADGETRWLETSALESGLPGWVALASFEPGERVVVAGKLTHDEQFRRMATAPHPSPFVIEPVERGADRWLDEVLVPTRDREVRLRVQRTGSSGPAVFRIQGAGLEGRLEPQTLTLSDGQPEEVVLHARASQAAPSRATTGTLTVSVGAEQKDREGNSFVVRARVGKDSDGDGFSDEVERFEGTEYDGDRDGVPDVAQREVATFSTLLSSFSMRFRPDAVLTSFDRAVLLGKDLPSGVREAPYGAWRLGIGDGANSAPKWLRIHLGQPGMRRVDRLLVFDAESNNWRVRAHLAPGGSVLALGLTDAERQALRAGELIIALVR